jgi:U3 small nucleolar RNA-associated protein 19
MCVCCASFCCCRCGCSILRGKATSADTRALGALQKVLAQMHVSVVPHLTNPLLLSDFLTRAVNLGSLLGMLALNGMFLLMTQHGLEYAQFYVRLYGACGVRRFPGLLLPMRFLCGTHADTLLRCRRDVPPCRAGLLEPGIFHARHRRQFFELLDVFLRSTQLPAYLVASFAKRMARLALSAPPHGAMLAIGFAHNLLRRHPGCCVMVQREKASAVAGSAGDPFLSDEADPARARALESSLWEVEALRQHYSPAVSRFVAVLDRDVSNRLQTADVDVAALAGASYATLFAEDAERRLKAVPLAFYLPEQEPRGMWDDKAWMCPAAE